MERRKFTREFKLEAVRLIKQRGVGYAQASQDLSVHQSQLRSWVKAFALPQQRPVADNPLRSHWEMARPKRFELLPPRFVVWCSPGLPCHEDSAEMAEDRSMITSAPNQQ
ncbi:MAG: transposase [Hyphomicrobiales bacterium]